MTYVTQPKLPPLNELVKYLEKIWETKWITNKGIFHQKFEKALIQHCVLARLPEVHTTHKLNIFT